MRYKYKLVDYRKELHKAEDTISNLILENSQKAGMINSLLDAQDISDDYMRSIDVREAIQLRDNKIDRLNGEIDRLKSSLELYYSFGDS